LKLKRGYSNKNLYEANIELFKPINKDESKYGIYGQKHWMFILKKTERGPYWPRLLKDSKKVHWLKADWNKWKDEDEEEEEENDFSRNTDFNSMFQQMGGLGGDELPNLDDMEPPNEEEVDSDDESMSLYLNFNI
jgi:prostaglandin-E synthase